MHNFLDIRSFFIAGFFFAVTIAVKIAAEPYSN